MKRTEIDEVDRGQAGRHPKKVTEKSGKGKKLKAPKPPKIPKAKAAPMPQENLARLTSAELGRQAVESLWPSSRWASPGPLTLDEYLADGR